MRLPIEILIVIGSQLDHESMLSLALTARPVFNALATPMKLEMAVRQRYRNLKLEGTFQEPFLYLQFLKDLLYDERLAGYVVSLTCSEGFRFPEDRAHTQDAKNEHQAEFMSLADTETKILLDRRIAQMPWFLEQQRAEIVRRILTIEGESATLAILLCMLNRLRYFCSPIDWGSDVQDLVQCLSTCDWSVQHPTSPWVVDRTATFLPLDKLMTFEANVYNGQTGTHLDEALAWITLPSLRRAILPYCHQGVFTSPALPTNRMVSSPEIFLPHSSVEREGIAAFANFMPAPCIIRLTYTTDYHMGDAEAPSWDHYETTEDANGIKSVNFEWRYRGSDQHELGLSEDIDVPVSPAFRAMAEADYGFF